MTGTNHRSIQPRQDKFDTNGVSIGIYNHCSVTMSYFKQDFVGTFKKVRRDINVFYGPKVHTIYEGTIDWDINYATGHPRRVEIRNKGHCVRQPNLWHTFSPTISFLNNRSVMFVTY